MENADLNLLVALDALLAEGSVTGAARRLGLSTSAMSRTLTRLRSATGDPLLVRAGRGLVPTPHAVALRGRVRELARDAQAVLRPPADPLDIASLERTFTLRANEAFVELFAVTLFKTITRSAPRVRLRFAPKPNKDAEPLREGLIDLEIGVVEAAAPEMRAQALFRDRLVGVVRTGHPLLSGRGVTPKRLVAYGHVAASPQAMFRGPVDDALDALGLGRDVHVVVPGFMDAMRMARHSELVALAPRSCLGHASSDAGTVDSGLQCFDLPLATPDFTVSAIWHPRMDADPGHRWLRDVMATLCRTIEPAHRAG
ncbi:LysR family transcriptional regulator [Dyella sp.]|uniref:LysR family transcriptional regulator n=1 Tax=Dyella sp. TaxID=1869338 RepID=UPI002ED5383B